MVLLISRFNAFSGKLDFARYMIRACTTLEGRRNLENTGVFRVTGIFTERILQVDAQEEKAAP